MKKLILAFALLFTGASQAATITNGSFENGLAGWGAIGVSVSNDNVTDGANSALLQPNSVITVAQIENALGLGAGYFGGLVGVSPFGGPTDAALLIQGIGNVKPGEFISFDYTFENNDGASFNDSAVALIDGTGSLVDVVLGAGADASGSATLITSGVNNAFLAFVAFNQGDQVADPQLWVDNIKVPVPATFFLLGVGLLALGLVKRRKA